MKIRITSNTIADKKQVYVGDVLDLPEAEARFLIEAGKAVEDKSVIISDQPEIETADAQPAMETADIKSPRKKKG